MATSGPLVTHVGLTVTDLDKAIEWYQGVLGFQVLAGPIELTGDHSHFGVICSDIFGEVFRRGRLAFLSGHNGVGIELFEFNDPKSERPANNFEYWKNSIFHLAVIELDIENLTRRIEESGGRLRSKIWNLFPGTPYKIAYCEDPFGNIVEICSHSTDQMWRNQNDD
jgi:catechol 2,3-dioxygenase-like lactoylglutathione lyase family enzyme